LFFGPNHQHRWERPALELDVLSPDKVASNAALSSS
jgi:hypothetical protein